MNERPDTNYPALAEAYREDLDREASEASERDPDRCCCCFEHGDTRCPAHPSCDWCGLATSPWDGYGPELELCGCRGWEAELAALSDARLEEVAP